MCIYTVYTVVGPSEHVKVEAVISINNAPDSFNLLYVYLSFLVIRYKTYYFLNRTPASFFSMKINPKT